MQWQFTKTLTKVKNNSEYVYFPLELRNIHLRPEYFHLLPKKWFAFAFELFCLCPDVPTEVIEILFRKTAIFEGRMIAFEKMRSLLNGKIFLG